MICFYNNIRSTTAMSKNKSLSTAERQMERLYNVGYAKPTFIRNIKGNFRRFYFGTLNGK